MIDVVAAIIEQNGKILLAQRDSHRDQAGMWEFPGGKVEAGESQQQALIRELAEELNIRATVAEYIATNQWDSPKDRIRLHAWHIDNFSGELVLNCHSALVWLAPEDAYNYPLAPADIPLLEAFIARKLLFLKNK
ncbi:MULTISPECIES: pyrimidine (deoxy)nucleoside triphosphate diphosphatase [Yersinia]|uniref:pyrimidine (deoxy)nucleoside triphosphate diphosphatase n=1 Tax=Yersinia TaxID=629 RepID=UPI0005DDE9C2|nr:MULTISPECIES: pyrimidine (deoxy)nucleoside triphosphate diphosphatase [Yersinia]OVZ92040.1 NTP pyrophosphohydrolase [Yersinia frederiksenii]RXA93951.1 pyrimidine (deoxy)nucleoside triphosphate diphosphatase [Yersinia sp. 2105 StPb PI]CNI81084.1 pyrimidine (deoxy)nucleoside triphosphate pyrophosphohydrolase [Yersinia frederiksenii]CNJ18993.1 pyrimidine (deoxy)nucleoside triphosphate pyrophosphohydrolase [Yersinia frederiksenii]CNL27470.1 pyrimidine (deoxy)nucleoside triphosphate pyrophosphoh